MSAVVTFTTPPPGLSPLLHFDLEAVADSDGLYTLRALDAPDVRLFVIDAPLYLPDYNPEVTLGQLESIGASTPSQVRVLVVATMADTGPAANLMAPILVNESNGDATQIILEGDQWPLRMPLGA